MFGGRRIIKMEKKSKGRQLGNNQRMIKMAEEKGKWIPDRYNCKECRAYTCDNSEHEKEMIWESEEYEA